ncbi:MAG: IS66 family transposase [Myxococcales bacterium]|nr:IS66 family transposase [Myxococcales bacterium]
MTGVAAVAATTPVAPTAPSARGKAPRAAQQVRDSALALVAAGQVSDAVELCLAALSGVLRQCHDLELQVAKLRRERAASRSERVDPAQLLLLLELMGGQAAAVVPDPESEAQEDAELEKATRDAEDAHTGNGAGKKRNKRARRKGLATGPGVEKLVHEVELPEAARVCGICGALRPAIGVDVTHRLEWVPGHFVDHEYHLAKHACAECQEGVSTAPAPAQVIPRSAVDASLVAQVIVSKFVDHQPLHRIHDAFARNGATIPVSTLSDWMGATGEILRPLVDCLGQRILGAYVVRIDGTGIQVLDRKSAMNVERGTMWGCVGDDRDVLFRYRPTGAGLIGPWDFLKGRTGYVQADAATVFDRLYNGRAASAIEIGCWSHGRRRLVALKDSDCRVAWPLLLIGRLYRIESLADARRLSFDERRSLRQELSTTVLDKIRGWLVPTLATEPPSSDLAKAASYLVNQWQALTRFLQDGRLDLDNNLCERQMRAIALGRRNYLFCGSHEAAAHTAVFYSLTRTCALHGIPPLAYLTDVLRKLAGGWLQSRIEELLPGRWSPG